MKNIERANLVNAVMTSRDGIDPELETELLEAIIDAETDFAGDGAVAMHAIDLAVSAAIDRGVGCVERAESAESSEDDVNRDGYDQEHES